VADNPPRREVNLRYREVSRLEGFSDAVFGFALTLLVVQLEVPGNSERLVELVRGSVPFAVTFAMICYIWWEHNKFFRRYGLQDAWTAFLNCFLLFLVLFYVYPLKFLATALLGGPLGMAEYPRNWDSRFVMLIYSVGVTSVFGVFIMLYRHAWSRRQALELTEQELITLRFNSRAHKLTLGLGVISILLAATINDDYMGIAGMLYGLMGPLHAWNGFRMHRALDQLKAKAEPVPSNA
jgi:uncharacterized membrane protein